MSNTKKGHFVPQFLLRSFSSDEVHVWAFDKWERRSFNPNIKDIAAENFFYDIPPDAFPTRNPKAIEETLCVLEGRYKSGIRELLDEVRQTGRFTPGPIYRNQIVAHFLIMQEFRTRLFRDTLTDLTRQMTAILTQFYNIARGYSAEKWGQPVPEEIFPPHVPETTPLNHANVMFDHEFAARLMDILFGHAWLIGENRTSQPMYISDAPVIRYSHARPYQGSGFQTPGVEILLPLSSKYILIMLERAHFQQPPQMDGRVLPLDEDRVFYYNCSQVRDSRRQIYCEEDKFDTAREFLADRPEYGEPDRSRFQIG